MSRRQRIDARAHISSKNVDSKSSIDALYQQGSARIRFPSIATDTQPAALQAVLINTAGGLTGDDRIHWQGTACANSHLSISTAACEKIYRTHGPDAHQQTTLQIANNARLEWLPQEAILFDGSKLSRTLNVELETNAEALLVESLVFGRQAMQERIDNIAIHDSWRIYRNNRLLHAEDFRLNMQDQSHIQSPCVMHQHRAISTLILINNRGAEWLENTVQQIRQLAKPFHQSVKVGASALPHRLVVRVLATDSYHLRNFLLPCVTVLNDGRPVPTVWNV